MKISKLFIISTLFISVTAFADNIYATGSITSDATYWADVALGNKNYAEYHVQNCMQTSSTSGNCAVVAYKGAVAETWNLQCSKGDGCTAVNMQRHNM